MDLDLTFDMWHPGDLEAFGTGFYADVDDAINNVLNEYGPQVVNRAVELCPVRTGTLALSLDYDVDEASDELVIFSDVSYYPYVEYGTVNFAGFRMVGEAMDEYEAEIMDAVDNAIADAAQGYE